MLGSEDRAFDPLSIGRLLRGALRRVRRSRNGDTLDEFIDEREESERPLDEGERVLLANILSLRERTVEDAMVPRADITAVHMTARYDEVIDLMTRAGHSRLPVYRETLDDAVGMIHIRDVLAWRDDAATFRLSKVMRKVLFVAPSMQVLELLLEMRTKRVHMALVVDEFGGIDGLVTIEDLVEEIVGEIQDEHDDHEEESFVRREDGAIGADARTAVELLEKEFGPILSDEERDEIDTLGGLVFSLAGRVPIRGELIRHPSGLEFEVVDADPRRIHRLRVHAIDRDSARSEAEPERNHDGHDAAADLSGAETVETADSEPTGERR